MKKVTEYLPTTVDDIWKLGGQNRYQAGVRILLLQWKDDDVGLATEIDVLGGVSYKSYHYNVETWGIPGTNAVRELQVRLGEFVKKHDKHDALLIFYHSGHTEQNIRRSEPPTRAS